MRLHYYRFLGNSDPMVRFTAGCAVILKTGNKIYPESIPEDKWSLIEKIDDTLEGITITYAKKLLRQHGGIAWTCHCERDGSVFETTEITINGNNSRFKYNHHL